MVVVVFGFKAIESFASGKNPQNRFELCLAKAIP
jgi:hypothetical protein